MSVFLLYILRAYRERRWAGIIQNLKPFVDWERSWMNLCLHWPLWKGDWFIVMVDSVRVGLLMFGVFFFPSILKHQLCLCFQAARFSEDSKLSKVSEWQKVVMFQARLAMSVIYTQEIFRSLRTEEIIRGEKGVMVCRNGSTSYFDRLTRIPAPWKIYKHCLPGLLKNRENFDEMLN